MITDKEQEEFSRKVNSWIRENGLKVGEERAFVCEGQVIVVHQKWDDGAEWSFFYDERIVDLNK